METTRQVLTQDQADVLNEARRILEQVARDAGDAAWSAHPNDRPASGAVYAHDFGRLAGVAAVTGAAVFDVLNTASNYCEQDAAKQAIDSYFEKADLAS